MSEVKYRVERETEIVTVRLSEEAAERVETLRRDGKCLGCELPIVEGQKVTCGCHHTCYVAAMAAIKAKKKTRTELIRDGRMLAPGKPGRKAKNPFVAYLNGETAPSEPHGRATA